jgi:cytochrome c5
VEKIVKRKILLCMFVGLASIFTAQAAINSDDDIKSRIAPVGKVHVAGAKAETASAGGPRSGADIYSSACVACHSSGVLGAPKFQNAADWAPRLEQGFDTVWQHAINGLNAMPPRGTCGDCSDDEIKAAIEHMIEGL